MQSVKFVLVKHRIASVAYDELSLLEIDLDILAILDLRTTDLIGSFDSQLIVGWIQTLEMKLSNRLQTIVNPKKLPDERFRRLLNGWNRLGENSAGHFNYDVDWGQEVIMKLPDTNGQAIIWCLFEKFRPF